MSASDVFSMSMGSFVTKIFSSADTLVGDKHGNFLFGLQGNDTLDGQKGNDTLIGGAGKDKLTGGAGKDKFKFTKPTEGGDTIKDFSASQGDKLVFVSPNFGNLKKGTLSASNFLASKDGKATGSGQRFVFNTKTGTLSYDADGNGSAAAVTVATLNVKSLKAGDILIAAS
ncbi:MAG: calcium-binding protein [Magnetococcales bacterium]|nr:calcium-binding protein [Magnetococcales bacterium]